VSEAEFNNMKAMVEDKCPLNQIFMSSGVKVVSNWKLKKID
jgi:hypothetical protein